MSARMVGGDQRRGEGRGWELEKVVRAVEKR